MEDQPKLNEYADDFLGDNERSHVLANLQRQNPRARVAAREQASNRPSQCPDCGSTWFFEATFNQYRADTYSATAGGDLEVISEVPQMIRVCLCGRPLEPNIGGAFPGGHTPNAAMESFRKSMHVALTHIARCSEDIEPKIVAAMSAASTRGSLAEVIDEQGKNIASLAETLTDLRVKVAQLAEKPRRANNKTEVAE